MTTVKKRKLLRAGNMAGLFTLCLILLLTASAGPSGFNLKTASADSVVWNGTIATTYAGGTGTANNPYLIATGEQLARLAQEINASRDNNTSVYYALVDNIILNNTSNWTSWSATVAPTNRWTPIGIGGRPFGANFDGRGHAVRGIYINATTDQQGLFGSANGGTIKNVGVEQSYIRSTGMYTAGIVGFGYGNLMITNCYNSGTVWGSNHCSAGIIAYANSANIVVRNCYNTGTILNTVHWVAGISGCMVGTVINCYNTGTITMENTGGNYAGGIVGENRSGIIVNSYNAGRVNGGSANTGGIVGVNFGKVANCYSNGIVSGSHPEITGGVAGVVGEGWSVAFCYWATGSASSSIGTSYGTVSNVSSYNTYGTLTTAVTVNGVSCTTVHAALNGWIAWTAGYIAPPAGVTYASWNTAVNPTFSSWVSVSKPDVYAVTFGPRGAAAQGTVTATLGGVAIVNGQLQQADQPIIFTAAPAATPAPGYSLKQWWTGGTLSGGVVTGGSVISGQVAATYTSSTRTAAAVISHEFQQRYTITVTGGTSNKANGIAGETATLTPGAAPANQAFFSWSVTGAGASVSGNTLTIGTANVTAAAVWGSTVSYSVYNGAGGTVTASSGNSGALVQVGSNVTFTASAATGWRVLQWRRDGAVVQTGATATYTLTNLQAHTTVTVEFEMAIAYLPGANGTGTSATDYKVFGTDITLRNAAMFTRYGYTQTGWTTTDGGAQTHAFGSAYTANTPLTLYPAWTAVSGIAVTFAVNGGQPSNPAPLSVTFDSPYGELPELTRSGGYNFGGWWTLGGAGGDWGSQATSATLVKNASAHTLYARWLVDQYLISYYDAGGTALSVPADGLPTMFEAPAGAVIPVPAERQGYTFAGWYLDMAGTQQPLTAVDGGYRLEGGGAHRENVDLYARWAPNQYVIRYNGIKPQGASNTISGATANSAHTYDEAKALNLNGFGLAGWHFTGWAVSSGSTTVVYREGQSVMNLAYANGAVVNLYTVWERNEYRVVYNQNKPAAATGTVAGYMEPTPYTYDKGTAESLSMNTYSLNGWTFLGWMTRPDAAVSDPVNAVVYNDGEAVENLTTDYDGVYNLYAVWRPNTYTIVYHGNQEDGAAGSSGTVGNSTASSVHTYDSLQSLTLNGFTLTGWHFTEWWTTAAGVGTRYTNGQSVMSLAAADGAVVNLYAFWAPNNYTIEYRANKPGNAGGTVQGTTGNSSHTYDVRTPLTRGGYSLAGWTFLGWSRNADGTGTLYADMQNIINVTPDENAVVILYARWRANTYTIRYDKNDPSAQGTTSPSTHSYDSGRRLTYNGYTLAGFTFGGWAVTPGGPAVYADGELVSNLTAASGAEITLYAVWEPAKYTLRFIMPYVVDGNMEPLYPDVETEAPYGALISALVPAVPDIPGMVFIRWEGLITGPNAPDMTVAGNHVFTSVYMPDTTPVYAVRFEFEDGDEILSIPDVLFGTYIAEILPEAPGRTGWTFVRWEGYEQWMTVTGDHTFRAVFELDIEQGGVTQYTLTFYDTDGATVIYTAQAFYGSSVSAVLPAVRQIDGYVFMGWQGYVYGMVVTANHSFTAEYRIAPVPAFTVIFYDEDGETVILRLDNVAQGTMISALIPPAPLHEDKTFVRWEGFGIYMTVESNHSFRAVYHDTATLKYYTVIFYDDDGLSLIKEISPVAGGTPVATLFPSAPFKPGHVFAGWKGYIANMNVYENLIFTATYTRTPAPAYSITFIDMWGGIFYQANNIPYGTLISMIVPASAPIVEGWTFVSWGGYESWMTVVTSNHIFQAQYRLDPAPCVITFLDEDEGTVIAVREGVLQGTSISALLPQPPVKAGRVFTGWKYYDEYEGVWHSYASGMTAERDTAFVAVYAEDTPEEPLPRYTATFLNFDDTTLIELHDIPEGTLASMLFPAAPPRTGYVFTGWECRIGGEWVACPAGLKVTEDMVFRTAWQAVGVLYTLSVNGVVVGRYEANTSFYIYITIPYGQEFDRWEFISGLTSLPAPDAYGRVYVTMPARDVQLSAIFKDIPKFKVEFETGDDDVAAPVEQWVLRNGLIAPVPVPQKEGYMLLGWFAEGSLTPWNFALDTVTEDLILTARWKQVAFSVTVDDSYKGEHKSGSTVTVWLRVPQGKYFDGWEVMDGISSVTDNGDGSFSFTMPENDVILTAKYADVTVITYTVTFETDGGSYTPEPQTVNEGGKASYALPPSKAGFIFLYWYDDTNGDRLNEYTPYDFAAPVTGPLVLRAKWLDERGQDNHTLKAEGVTGSGTYTAGEEVTIWLQPPAGKGFNGNWTLKGIFLTDITDNGDGSFTFAMPSNDVEIKAVYEPLTYNIYVSGGSYAGTPEYGETITLLYANPNPLTHRFIRFESADAAIVFNGTDYFFIMPGHDVTVTAVFEELDETVKYSWAEVKGAAGTGYYPEGYLVTVRLQPDTGMEFAGWTMFGIDGITLNPDGSYSFEMPDNDVQLIADYRFITYTVYVHGGDYDGEPEYGQTITLYHYAPPMGQRFIRYESSDVIIGYDGSGYTFTMPAHDVEIYAVFENIPMENVYTVRVTGATGTGNYADGTVLTVWPQIPQGQRFEGWAKAVGIPEGGLVDNGNGSYTFTVNGRNIDLEAAYTDIPKFTVTFDTDDSDTPIEHMIYEGDKAVYISPTERDGYIFLGWYYGDTMWDFENGVVGADITLTARWQSIEDIVPPVAPPSSRWIVWMLSGFLIGATIAILILIFRKKPEKKDEETQEQNAE